VSSVARPEDTVAKKKAKPKKVAVGPKPNALVIRGSAEWREWLKRVAEVDRTSVADVIDRALVDYARKIGVKELPPKR
jgi:hypothetical protein